VAEAKGGRVVMESGSHPGSNPSSSSSSSKKSDAKEDEARAGLCARCQHVQRVKSDRGSEFYRCGKAASDPRFAKYPRLPVLQCAGYEVVAGG
jgi:hypothetical protein